MDHYYLNRQQQPTGEHEIHRYGCPYGAHPNNRIDLGWCTTEQEALIKARRYTPYADGCYYCCPLIHQR